MKLSEQGIAFLKKAEGFSPGVYEDAGKYSIGYGCQVDHATWRDVCMTEAQAETFLRARVCSFEKILTEAVKVPLEQHQADALVIFCVAPETRILTADFRWVEAGSVFPGLEIWGIDEENFRGDKSRKLRIGVVESVRKFCSPRLVVITDCGEIIVTPDHRLLVRSGMRMAYRWVRADRLSAKLTKTNGRRGGFRHGEYYAPWLPPWEAGSDYTAGYLAGFLDGEGCASIGGKGTDRGISISFSQNDGIAADSVVRLLRSRGFVMGHYKPRHGYSQYAVQGGLPELFRLLGIVRPVRLIVNAMRKWDGVRGIYAMPKAHVLDVCATGLGEVVSIQTSIGTFFSNGLISHNCFNIGASAFRASTLVRRLNAGKFQEAADQFLRWIYSEGKPSENLKARRKLERRIFLGEIVDHYSKE